MIVIQVVLGISVVAYIFYALATVIATFMWRRKSPCPPFHSASAQPVTILKPVQGWDAQQLANFRSFCKQDYSQFQIIFGVLDPDDIGLEAARAVQDEFPNLDIAVVSGGEVSGLNRKVCNLIQMLPHAKHNLLVLADSDMRVNPEYISQIVAPFASENIGLNTCPYRGSEATNIVARLESIGIGADFIPSAFVGYYLGNVRFAFGSTIVIRKSVLEEIGGFEGLKDELADDYLLASKTRLAGKEVWLSNYFVDDVIGTETVGVMWSRRLRWAKTSRAMQPIPYMGSFVTHGFALSIMFLAAVNSSKWGLLVVTIVMLVRLISVVTNSITTNNRALLRSIILLPMSDLLSFALFVASFTSSRIRWRDELFRIGKGGKLTR